MAGYTPVFDTVFNGTLCGKWPELPVWLTLLPLADWQGHIDMTPEAIAARTGWPLNLLLQGIEILCQPDPRSRSKEEDGRRLILIDPERQWGWRVVNIQKYRERSRDQNRVADGRHAEKMRKWRENKKGKDVTRSDPEVPDETRCDSTQTHTQTHTQTKKEEKKGIGGARLTRAATAKRLPKDFELSEQRRAIAKTENLEPEREFSKFTDYWLAASGASARKHDWDAAWRNWCRKAQDMRPNGRGHAAEEPKLTWRPPADEDEVNAGR